MSRHSIEVDNEVFEFLKEHAEPFVDTPNSVLRKMLLGTPGKGEPLQATVQEGHSPYHHSGNFRSRLGQPASLEQILEVVDLVVRGGKDRIEATHLVARRRGVAFQTVLDKYTRQLGIEAARFESLLAQAGQSGLRRLLLERFPRHADEIRKLLDSSAE